MSAPLLSLRNVAVRRGTTTILDGVTLDLRRGEFAAIVGPSGAGKSTLFEVLTGGLVPDRGEVLVEGRPLGHGPCPFAFMPQRDALLPWQRVIDNLTLGLEVQGVPRRAARDRVRPHLDGFGLAGFERHWPSQLSGGMRQRAALLRTVAQDRPILLLDEPLGALDALTRITMQRWIEQRWLEAGWSVLLVTHDVREAVALSDRIHVLSPRPSRIMARFDVDLPRPRLDDGTPAGGEALERAVLAALLAPSGDIR